MVSEAMLSESILSLASAIAEKDVTSQGNGTKAKALEVLGNVLEAKGIQQLEGDDAIYALSQYAQRKSSDTVAAALGVGGCASGMVKPEGTITITENGEGIDVAQYATADVSVSGGGGTSTTDVYLWNSSEDFSLMAVIPTKAAYLSGISDGVRQYSELAFTEIEETVEIQGTTVTFHGIKLTDAPVGALLELTMPSNYAFDGLATVYAEQSDAMSVMDSGIRLGETVPMPLGGMVVAGVFSVTNVS